MAASRIETLARRKSTYQDVLDAPAPRVADGGGSLSGSARSGASLFAFAPWGRSRSRPGHRPGTRR